MSNFAPNGVTRTLYSGISDGIKWLGRMHESLGKDYVKTMYDDLYEALNWYEQHCMVSYTYLKNDFDELTKILKEKEVIR